MLVQHLSHSHNFNIFIPHTQYIKAVLVFLLWGAALCCKTTNLTDWVKKNIINSKLFTFFFFLIFILSHQDVFESYFLLFFLPPLQNMRSSNVPCAASQALAYPTTPTAGALKSASSTVRLMTKS